MNVVAACGVEASDWKRVSCVWEIFFSDAITSDSFAIESKMADRDTKRKGEQFSIQS